MSDKKVNILIIPIDNRPVCYDLCVQAAAICNDISLFIPPIDLLGGLTSDANIDGLQNWTKSIIDNNNIDIALIALDTIAYGGLIPSRRTNKTFDQIRKNVDDFISCLKSKNENAKIYAFSSIMRISNNNCNEEEKSYWSSYGKDLFRFSYLSHMLLRNYDVELESELIKLAKMIPFEVVDDYLNTRKRNFDINNYYLDLVRDNVIDKIVFSQDDTAEYGFNVEEKELLWRQAIKEVITPKVTIKTGADEMILSLLTRSLIEFYNEEIKISPKFFDNNAKDIISRYEDISIQKSVEETIKLSGAQISQDADIELLINAPNKIQDDLCLGIEKDEKSTLQADRLIEYLKSTDKNYAIADIQNANGADNYLLDKITQIPFNKDRFFGFAAWNTTGNTLGTVIALSAIKYLAQKLNAYEKNAFLQTQFVRLMDDWAYQANVRKILRQKGTTESVKDEMQPYKENVSEYLGYCPDSIDYTFPWNRTFEIKINC